MEDMDPKEMHSSSSPQEKKSVIFMDEKSKLEERTGTPQILEDISNHGDKGKE